jgi:UbiD family decarboxylase
MPFKDLREFISALQDRHEIKSIDGASAELEIGAVTQIGAESAQCPAILFDAIPGFRKGQRVLTNVLANKTRERLLFGVSQDLTEKDALIAWKDKLTQYQPVAVANSAHAPVKQNILAEGQIDLATLPWLRWQEDEPSACQHGTLVVTKDPRSGEIGIASHSFARLDRDTLAARVENDSGINPVWQEYWAHGKDCPVAISLGHDPALLAATLIGSPLEILASYGIAGWLRGAPVEVTDGEYTGMPIPATAEIVLEGEIEPPPEETGDQTQNHPLGPTVKIHRLYFRNDPIILATAPFLTSIHGVLASRSAALWIELEKRGIAGINAINHRGWGVTIVAIKQLDGTHVKRVSRALMESFAGRDLCHAIVVDEDIDPFNLEKVFWAIATRYEPQVALDIVRRLSHEEHDVAGAKKGGSTANNPVSAAIIDACRPYRWIDKFPRTTDISKELMKRTVEKWGKVLERKT